MLDIIPANPLKATEHNLNISNIIHCYNISVAFEHSLYLCGSSLSILREQLKNCKIKKQIINLNETDSDANSSNCNSNNNSKIILTIKNNQEWIQDKSLSKNMNQWKLLVTVGKELDLPVTAALDPSVNNNIIGSCSYRISSNKCPRRLLNFETVRCDPIRWRHFYFKVREINNIKYQHIVIFLSE